MPNQPRVDNPRRSVRVEDDLWARAEARVVNPRDHYAYYNMGDWGCACGARGAVSDGPPTPERREEWQRAHVESLPTNVSAVIRAALEDYTRDDAAPTGTGKAGAVWREVARSVRRGEAVTVVDPKAGGPE